MNNENFNPALSSRLLGENARKIEEVTNKIIEKRNALLLAEAALLDSKAASYKKHLEKVSATAAQQLVTLDTLEEKKVQMKAEVDLKNLQDLLSVLETSNNNLKMRIRLFETETQNLNL